MLHTQLLNSAPSLPAHLDLQSVQLYPDRCQTQRHSHSRHAAKVKRFASSGAESTSERHNPRPRQLDRAAAAYLRGQQANDDLIEATLVGLGVVAVAAAAGLELLSAHWRHQHQAARTQAADAFERQRSELRAEVETAEARGRRGRQDMDGIQRRQVQIAVDMSDAAVRQPSLGTAHP